MRVIACLTLLLACCVSGRTQQVSPEVVATSGERFTDGSLTLEWTLGEVVIETITDGSLTLTQGFHQPEFPGQTLPVSWLSFAAVAGAKKVNLYWETTLEQDNAGFHVERSATGRFWEVIGEVNAEDRQPQEYVFTDGAPLSGTNHYRIRQTDFGGQTTYSEVETVVFSSKEQLFVYPNPATGRLNVRVPPDAALLGLYSAMGQKTSLFFSRQHNHFITDVSQLPSGIYFLRVRLAGGVLITQRVVAN